MNHIKPFDNVKEPLEEGENPVNGSHTYEKQLEKELNDVVKTFKRKLDAEQIHDVLEIVYNQSKNQI